MILVNTDYIEGKKFEMIGLAEGSTVQSVHLGKDIAAGFKTLVGGELKSYANMLTEAREVAKIRMISAAEALGADAIINIRYTTSAITQGAAEILAYGTAVRFI